MPKWFDANGTDVDAYPNEAFKGGVYDGGVFGKYKEFMRSSPPIFTGLTLKDRHNKDWYLKLAVRSLNLAFKENNKFYTDMYFRYLRKFQGA